MKILYLHQYFNFPTSHGTTRSYEIAQKFIENGHEVEIITLGGKFSSDTEKRWNTFKKENILFHALNNLSYDNSMSKIQRMTVFFRFFWFTTFKLLSLKGDVVLATSTPLTIGIPALFKKWFQGTPFIFEVRDVWPEVVIAIGAIKNRIFQRFLIGLESLIYKNADALVPLSTDMEASILARFKNLKAPIVVIENISELERYEKGFDPNRALLNEKLGFKPRFAILYAGSFGRINGLHYAVELAAKLLPLDPTIVFVLMGVGSEKEKITQLAVEKQVLSKNLFIVEPVTKNVLPQMYHETQMGSSFVIPIKELWANSANKFFDTLAAKRPVLINYGGWQKHLLLERNAGFVFPPDLKSIDSVFLEQFIAYTKDTKEIEQHRKNALELAKKFSLTEASIKYNKILAIISSNLNI